MAKGIISKKLCYYVIPTLIVALTFQTSEKSLDVINEWLNVLCLFNIPFAPVFSSILWMYFTDKFI